MFESCWEYMLTSFEQMLVDKGYSRNRVVFEGKKGSRTIRYEPVLYNASFSSLGDIDFRYLKDGQEFIYGLHEVGKPPTLVSPRPIVKKGKYVYNESCMMPDDIMNRVFKEYSNEQIYDAIQASTVLEIEDSEG